MKKFDNRTETPEQLLLNISLCSRFEMFLVSACNAALHHKSQSEQLHENTQRAVCLWGTENRTVNVCAYKSLVQFVVEFHEGKSYFTKA